MHRFYASIAPGLEGVLADELGELGIEGSPSRGGIEFEGDLAALYRVHLHARTPARVVLRLGSFRAANLAALAAQVRKLPWSTVLVPRQPVVVRVSSRGSRMRRRDAVERKVEHAIADGLRGPRRGSGRPPREALLVLVRLEGDRAVVSVDASGALLHLRGWRRDAVAAPIRENLGAAVLRAAEWAPGEALVDPMAGSGTLCIEAAQATRSIGPGRKRSFAFEHWPLHDAAAFARAARSHGAPSDAGAPILGGDRDPAAVRAARANARRAGVADRIRWVEGDCASLEPPADRGLVVCNPPYGPRLAAGASRRSFDQLGRALRSRWGGWRFAVIAATHAQVAALRLPSERIAQFASGGIDVQLVSGAVP